MSTPPAITPGDKERGMHAQKIAFLIMVAVLLVEALALLGFWWLTGRGLAPRSVFALVLPGVFFALALRAALTGAWWGFVSLAMTAAFFAHAWDLWRRWRD